MLAVILTKVFKRKFEDKYVYHSYSVITVSSNNIKYLLAVKVSKKRKINFLYFGNVIVCGLFG